MVRGKLTHLEGGCNVRRLEAVSIGRHFTYDTPRLLKPSRQVSMHENDFVKYPQTEVEHSDGTDLMARTVQYSVVGDDGIHPWHAPRFGKVLL